MSLCSNSMCTSGMCVGSVEELLGNSIKHSVSLFTYTKFQPPSPPPPNSQTIFKYAHVLAFLRWHYLALQCRQIGLVTRLILHVNTPSYIVTDSRLGSWLQRHPLHRHLPLDKGRRWLVVDRRQCSNMANKLIKQGWFKKVSLLRNGRLLC